eukprot:2227510-Amphidinium_carterae.1
MDKASASGAGDCGFESHRGLVKSKMHASKKVGGENKRREKGRGLVGNRSKTQVLHGASDRAGVADSSAQQFKVKCLDSHQSNVAANAHG